MFKKIKKSGLKFLVVSLTYILSFSSVNAMDNNNNSSQSRNYDQELENEYQNVHLSAMEHILDSDITLGYKFKEAEEAINIVEEFKNYIISKRLTMKKIENKNMFENIRSEFNIKKGEEFRNYHKNFQKNDISPEWSNKKLENSFSSLSEFMKNVKNVETLREYLENIITKLSSNGEYRRNITSQYDEILSTIERDKENNILKDKEKIKNKVNEAFMRHMSECEELILKAEKLKEWFDVK